MDVAASLIYFQLTPLRFIAASFAAALRYACLARWLCLALPPAIHSWLMPPFTPPIQPSPFAFSTLSLIASDFHYGYNIIFFSASCHFWRYRRPQITPCWLISDTPPIFRGRRLPSLLRCHFRRSLLPIYATLLLRAASCRFLRLLIFDIDFSLLSDAIYYATIRH